MLELLAELIFEIFGELLLQLLFELLAESGLRSVVAPFRRERNPYVATTGYVVRLKVGA